MQLIESASKVVKALKEDAARHRTSSGERPVAVDDSVIISIAGNHSSPNPSFAAVYDDIFNALCFIPSYQPLEVNEYLPEERRKRFQMIDYIKRNGFNCEITWYSRTFASNMDAMHFVWSVNKDGIDHEQQQLSCIKTIDKTIPQYHSKLVKSAFIKVAAKLNVTSSKARALFNIATNDAGAASNEVVKAVDERLAEALQTEDADIVLDLRSLNKRPRVYDPFFDAAAKYIESAVETAVDDRRHGNISHLAVAMSASDLHK